MNQCGHQMQERKLWEDSYTKEGGDKGGRDGRGREGTVRGGGGEEKCYARKHLSLGQVITLLLYFIPVDWAAESSVPQNPTFAKCEF